MINIIFTGLIRTEDRFRQSIKDFIFLRNEKKVNQIILSTWIGEVDSYTGMREYLENNNITLVESIPPIQCKGSILYQMKSLHLGLDTIEDKSLMIFKTRPDLHITKDALEDITNLNLELDKTIPTVFEKKVWLPWFEISKPFYLADECFFATYNDTGQLVNYNMIYDSYYEIDSGLSHIRRFIEPFVSKYPILKTYLTYLGTTAHGTTLRFKVLDEFAQNKDYLKFLDIYYYILQNYFYIGLDDTKQYITFRKWSEIDIKLPNSINQAFAPKYSWNQNLGHIFSTNNYWLKSILDNKTVELDFIVDKNALEKLHEFAITKKNEASKSNKITLFLQKVKKVLKV